MIEFTPSGDILSANANFLSCVGYTLNELKGRNHRILCDDAFYEENPASGKSWLRDSSSPGSSCGATAMAMRSGWRPPTTPFATRAAR